MNVISQIQNRYERTVTRARERWPLVDHAWRAKERYAEVLGSRLAAGISYYGFFAVFALAVVAYAVLGFLVENDVTFGERDLRSTVDEFLQENLPVLENASQISQARGTAGLLGLAGLVLAGVAWVEALRSSQRLIWAMEPAPGNVILRRLLDVVVLVVLALLLGASFAVAAGIETLLSWLPATGRTVLGWVLTIAVNLLLATALLMALPRVRMPARRFWPVAIAVAAGIFLLNTVGSLYIGRVQDNPAYAVVAAAAGLLVYLYLLHQLVLWAATWAATSEHGEVSDVSLSALRSSTSPDSPD